MRRARALAAAALVVALATLGGTATPAGAWNDYMFVAAGSCHTTFHSIKFPNNVAYGRNKEITTSTCGGPRIRFRGYGYVSPTYSGGTRTVFEAKRPDLWLWGGADHSTCSTCRWYST